METRPPQRLSRPPDAGAGDPLAIGQAQNGRDLLCRRRLDDRVRQINIYVHKKEASAQGTQPADHEAEAASPALLSSETIAETLRKRIAAQPRDFEAHFQLGLLLSKKVTDDEAIKHLKIARDLLPEDAASLFAIDNAALRFAALKKSEDRDSYVVRVYNPTNTRQRGRLTFAAPLAKAWRTERALRRLEALLAVADKDTSLVISGNGDVIEPEDNLIALGSGGAAGLAHRRLAGRRPLLGAPGAPLRSVAPYCQPGSDSFLLIYSYIWGDGDNAAYFYIGEAF